MSDADGRLLPLTAAQRSTLSTFQEIAHISDDYLCLQILEENAWNLDAAVNQFVQGAQSPAVPRQSRSTRADTGTGRAGAGTGQARTSSSDIQRRYSPVVSNNSGWFSLVFTPLRWLFQVRPTSLNPETDTQRFVDDYDRAHSARPDFFRGSYVNAVAAARQQSKFLIVYLHSPMHEDTIPFCSNVLSNAAIIEFMNQHAIVWAGRIWDPEAYGLSSQLGASSFPFLSLLVCQSDRTAQIADRIQGSSTDPEVVQQRLQNGMNAFSTILDRHRLEAQRRTEAQLLREEQDREFREAQERDRLASERQAEEERERQAREEEERQQAELEAAMELSRRLTHEDTVRKLRNYFVENPEPDAGANVSAVKFQLPSGKKLARKFDKNDSIQIIFDFLTVHFSDAGDEVKHFSVCTHFPKVELTDMSQTIEAVGLHPRGMLYVQDLDA